ncbi:hypothetical protein [Kribbella solani]|uniref:hypothetical protein n=1 Tax=Kribbella solani TaxID=236067 RepID=UPI0029B552DC|nr:hypothetical protein [Kribbella solani]MDX2974177.1 hypothetical protein [Kribbella solani]
MVAGSIPRNGISTAQAELENLALAGYLALGDYEDAEGNAHRSLALLRPGMRRTRSITTARLAKARLGQCDLEEAVATAMSIPLEPTGLHPRINSMLQDFGSTLRIVAPSSHPQPPGSITNTTH